MTLSDEIVKQLRALLRSEWSRFKAKDRLVLSDCARDFANLQMRFMAGAINAAKFAKEKRHIDFQLSALKVIGEGRALVAFYQAAGIAINVIFGAAVAL